MSTTETAPPRSAVRAGIVGFGLVTVYAVVGLLQILVWNPLAAVPGATLGQIRADMALADEHLTATGVIVWAGIVIALAGAVLLMAAVREASRVGPVIAAYLVLLVFAAPGHFFVSFGPGMSLADTFMISGADHAPWGMVLYAASAAALAGLIVVIIRAARAAGPATSAR